MNLIELSLSDKERYNQFVAAQESGSFLQSWEWGSWQEKLGRKVGRFFIADDDGRTVGSAQTIVMPLPLGKYYVYIPYGPIIDSSTPRPRSSVGMQQKIIEELQKKFPEAVFIRVESKSTLLPTTSYQLPAKKSPNIQPAKTLVIDLTKTEDQLMAEMRHKTRYNIKLAQKHGVEAQDEFGLTIGKGLFTKESLELMYQTSKRQGYLAQDREYFAKLVDFFAVRNNKSDLKSHIYKALYQKELLASGIMLDFAKTRTYLFGGSSDAHKNIMAPYLLHWQAMLDAKTGGFTAYDFWGIETSAGDMPGFVRFKLGFGGRETTYPGAYDVIQNGLQYKIYKSMRALNKLRKKISR